MKKAAGGHTTGVAFRAARLLCAVAALFFLLGGVPSLALPVYRVVAEPYAPFEYEVAGVARGMDVEILERLAKQAGVRFQFVFQPWKRALQTVHRGEADAIFSLLRTPERERFLRYPDTPLYRAQVVLFAHDGFAGTIRGVEDLAGYRVGVVAGHSYGPFIDRREDFVRDVSLTIQGAVNKLMHGRYPLLLATRETGWHAVRHLQAEKIRQLPVVLHEAPYYIAVSRTSARGDALFSLLDTHLRRMEKAGEIERIRKPYGQTSGPVTPWK